MTCNPKVIVEIGDARRFSNADKLARYAGVVPVKFSSAGKGKEQSSRQGNVQLHGLLDGNNGVKTKEGSPHSSGILL